MKGGVRWISQTLNDVFRMRHGVTKKHLARCSIGKNYVVRPLPALVLLGGIAPAVAEWCQTLDAPWLGREVERGLGDGVDLSCSTSPAGFDDPKQRAVRAL